MPPLADVRQPLRPRRLELAPDEVPDVLASGRVALRAVAEIEPAERERHALDAVRVPITALPDEDERRVAYLVDDDGGRRTAVARQRLDREAFELRFRILLQPLVDQLLVDAGDAVQHDHAAT